MLETCPKKRMVIGITCLAVVTFFVLIVESRWTIEERKAKQYIVENNTTCGLTEDWIVVKKCHPCTDFEIASKNPSACVHTHNKEILRCKSGETVIRSCISAAWIDQRRFWIFECSMFVIGVISTAISFIRQKTLDRRTIQKIQRQLNQNS
ncbi:protein JTB [Hermetia illucens]|uniref:protein JTB n=1 Tax=Hermetia illucens TaxID=343691 RepID=UPI0018CC241B|nr:protein JTB [Hermetia illucens]